MISPLPDLPDLSALYAPGLSWPGSDLASPKEAVDPRQDAADPVDLSELARDFARQGGAFALFEFNYQSVHSVSLARDGKGVSRREFWQQSFEMHLTVGGDSDQAKALFEKLRSEFTPEKVSDRIAEFALGVSAGKGSAFGDLIRSAVEHGYAEARKMLGELDPAISDPLEETMRLVREKMRPKPSREDQTPGEPALAA